MRTLRCESGDTTMGNGRSLIQRILFATDFSTCARCAEAYAAYLAEAYGATVDVVHALEIYGGIDVATVQDHRETEAELAETVRRLQQFPYPVTSQQRAGIPDVYICEAAADHADLIVMGTHGRTGLAHILLGSTAERVLTMAPCPVLTVREPKGSRGGCQPEPIRFERVAVPIDFSVCSLDALEYGIQIAKDFDASLMLLHVLEPVSYAADLTFNHAAARHLERVTSQLTSMADNIRSHGISVREVIRGGLPTDSILEFVRTSDCDLVVMGTHGRRGISHLVRGSVAEAVLRRASCPVLAMKRLHFAPAHQRVVPHANGVDSFGHLT
ncbi:MAG: hypothetical protein C4293_16135 [Nitrospiraceae bacterium]